MRFVSPGLKGGGGIQAAIFRPGIELFRVPDAFWHFRTIPLDPALFGSLTGHILDTPPARGRCVQKGSPCSGQIKQLRGYCKGVPRQEERISVCDLATRSPLVVVLIKSQPYEQHRPPDTIFETLI